MRRNWRSCARQGSIAGIADWQEITPDRYHDWVGQRSEEFQNLYPIGSKAAKAGVVGSDAIFKLYCNGLATGKDTYLYSFSRDRCTGNARAMTEVYLDAMLVLEKRPDYTVDDVTKRHSFKIRWDRELKNNLRRRKQASYSPR